MHLISERPIGDILHYRSNTGYNDVLKCNRTPVTISFAYVYFCAQSCQGDIYKIVVHERWHLALLRNEFRGMGYICVLLKS